MPRMRRLDVGRKRTLLIFGGVLSVWIAGFFVARALWSTAGPSLEQGQRDERSSPEQATTDRAAVENLKREATEVADRLMRDFPNDPEAITVMAIMHLEFRETAAAVKYLEKWLQLDPNSANAYQGIGLVALRAGEYEKAVGMLSKALAIAPGMVVAREQLGEALMGLGDFEEAVAVLEGGTWAAPQTTETFLHLGAAYRRLRENEKAKENYQAALDLDPGLAEAYYGLAGACAKLGQADESRAQLEKYKAAAARARTVRMEGARRLGDLGLVRQAVAKIHMTAGQVYRKHRNARNAEEHWLEAAKLSPGDSVCRIELVSLYLHTNQTAKALKVLDQLAKIEPENDEYRRIRESLRKQP